jgi:hypothetical protein
MNPRLLGQVSLSSLFAPPNGDLFGKDRTLDGLLKDNHFKIAVADDMSAIAVGFSSILAVLRAQPTDEGGVRWELASPPLQTSEDRDAITSLLWINERHVAAGYIDGAVRVLNLDGELCLEQKFHSTEVIALRSSFHEGGSYNGELADGSPTTEIWVLYREGVAVSVPVYPFMSGDHFGDNPVQIPCKKWELQGQKQVFDICSAPAPPSLFHAHATVGQSTLIGVGRGPPLGFYCMGKEPDGPGFRQVVKALATTIGSTAITAVGALFGWGSPSASDEPGGGEGEKEQTIEDQDGECISCTQWIDDGRRFITRVSVDPTGRLSACADGFGRILLIDTKTQQVLRMFKGYRDAQVGWLHAPEYGAEGGQHDPHGRTVPIGPLEQLPLQPMGGTSYGLYLVLYSPRRGMVEVYRMRRGPRVMVTPVGDAARLVTTYCTGSNGSDSAGSAQGSAQAGPPSTRAGARARCFVIRKDSSDERKEGVGAGMGSAVVEEVVLDSAALQSVHACRSTQGHQEEGFTLHRFVERLKRTGGKKQQGKKDEAEGEASLQNELLELLDQIHSPALLSRVIAELATGGTTAAQGASSSAAVGGGVSARLHLLLVEHLLTNLAKAAAAADGGSDEGSDERSDERSGVAGEGGAIGAGLRQRHALEIAKLVWHLRWRRRLLQAFLMLEPEAEAAAKTLATISREAEGAKGGAGGEVVSIADVEFGQEVVGWMDLLRTNSRLMEKAVKQRQQQLAEEARQLGRADEHTVPVCTVEVFLRAFPPSSMPSTAANATAASTEEGAVPLPPLEISRVLPRAMRRAVLSLLFLPLLLDAFALQKVQRVHTVLALDRIPALLVEYFGEWLLGLPLGTLLAIPASHSSSALHRWLTGHLPQLEEREAVVDEWNRQAEELEKQQLYAGAETGVPGAVALGGGGGCDHDSNILDAIYDQLCGCAGGWALLQALLVSELCANAEEQLALQVETKSLGKVPSAGAGARWRRLQGRLRATIFIGHVLGGTTGAIGDGAIGEGPLDKLSVKWLEEVGSGGRGRGGAGAVGGGRVAHLIASAQLQGSLSAAAICAEEHSALDAAAAAACVQDSGDGKGGMWALAEGWVQAGGWRGMQSAALECEGNGRAFTLLSYMPAHLSRLNNPFDGSLLAWHRTQQLMGSWAAQGSRGSSSRGGAAQRVTLLTRQYLSAAVQHMGLVPEEEGARAVLARQLWEEHQGRETVLEILEAWQQQRQALACRGGEAPCLIAVAVGTDGVAPAASLLADAEGVGAVLKSFEAVLEAMAGGIKACNQKLDQHELHQEQRTCSAALDSTAVGAEGGGAGGAQEEPWPVVVGESGDRTIDVQSLSSQCHMLKRAHRTNNKQGQQQDQLAERVQCEHWPWPPMALLPAPSAPQEVLQRLSLPSIEAHLLMCAVLRVAVQHGGCAVAAATAAAAATPQAPIAPAKPGGINASFAPPAVLAGSGGGDSGRTIRAQDIRRMFTPHKLCTAGALECSDDFCDDTAEFDGNLAGQQSSEGEQCDSKEQRGKARMDFVVALLGEDPQLATVLAGRLGADIQQFRMNYVCALLEAGRDIEAEEQMHMLEDRQHNALGTMIMATAVQRLGSILRRMRQSPQDRQLLALVPSDVHSWVLRQQQQQQQPEGAGRGGAQTNPSLHALLNLLNQALNILPAKSRQHKQTQDMCDAVKTLLRAVVRV